MIDITREYRYPKEMEQYKSKCMSKIHKALSSLVDRYSTGILQDLEFDIEETDFNASYTPVPYYEPELYHSNLMISPIYYTSPSPGKLELEFLLHVYFKIRHNGTPVDWYSTQILEKLVEHGIPSTAGMIAWQEDIDNGSWYSQDIVLDFSKTVDRDTLDNWVEEYKELNK